MSLFNGLFMPTKTSTERLGWGESPMEETFVSMFPYLSSSSILKEASIGRNGLRICSSLLWGPCLFVSNLDVETNRFCLEPISFLTRVLLCLWTCKQAFEQMRNWIQCKVKRQMSTKSRSIYTKMSYLSHLKILLRSINIASQTKVRDLAHLTVAHQYISSGQIPVNKLAGKNRKTDKLVRLTKG